MKKIIPIVTNAIIDVSCANAVIKQINHLNVLGYDTVHLIIVSNSDGFKKDVKEMGCLEAIRYISENH